MGKTIGYFIAIMLLVIAVFGHFYFRNYRGTLIPNPFLFQIGSWVLGLLGIGVFYLCFKQEENQTAKTVNLWKENLRQHGEKIVINFDQCEVKSNFYYEEVAREHSTEGQMYNALIGRSDKNVEQQSRHSSVILFKHPDQRTGKEAVFVSPLIRKERVTLTVLLSEKKTTNIYVNRENRDDYFFDIDFLYKA